MVSCKNTVRGKERQSIGKLSSASNRNLKLNRLENYGNINSDEKDFRGG